MEPSTVEESSQASNDAFVKKNLNWNFGVNLIDIAFFTISLSVISRETVMPVLVSKLTDSKFAIGLIPALATFGYLIPQLLSASFTERLPYKKPITMFIGGVIERLPFGLIGIVLFFLAEKNPPLTLFLFFLLLVITSVGSGLATPPWLDMIAKVIPVEKRGLLSGVGNSIGAVMGIFGALLVGKVLASSSYPNNFAFLFILSFSLNIISFIGLALNREPSSLKVNKHLSLKDYLAKLPQILKTQHNYRRFIISRSLILVGTMATGFYSVFATERFMEGSSVASLTGLLTAVLISSQAICNLGWGFLADRLGHKRVLSSAAFLLMIAALLAFLASSKILLILTFIFLGSYLAADQVSALNIILEFCEEADRPTYIGLTNTLLAPLVALVPLLGAYLASHFGYSTLFATTAVMALLGGLAMTLWVREPRYKS